MELNALLHKPMDHPFMRGAEGHPNTIRLIVKICTCTLW